jgi:hypothetical protein
MQDLNLRPSAPKADALPNCANPRIDGASVIHLKDVTVTCPLSQPGKVTRNQRRTSELAGCPIGKRGGTGLL